MFSDVQEQLYKKAKRNNKQLKISLRLLAISLWKLQGFFYKSNSQLDNVIKKEKILFTVGKETIKYLVIISVNKGWQITGSEKILAICKTTKGFIYT